MPRPSWSARPLSNTVGTVLDPVLALRRRVRVDPGETIHAAFWTGVGFSRAQALSLVDKLGSEAAFQRAKTLSWARTEVQLRDLKVSAGEAQLFQEIAGRILYSDAALRARGELLDRNQLGQAALWAHGVSGDLPIVLALIEAEAGFEVVKQLLCAHAYWQSKCLGADLVILNTAAGAAAASLEAALKAAIGMNRTGPGAVVALRADAIPPEHRDFLQVAARAVFDCGGTPLREQLLRPRELPGAARLRRENSGEELRTHAPHLVPALEYFNGLGGFDSGAREYVIVLDDGQWTPAPWINVIANPQFGFLASADGSGSTWSLNAQQNQLTPWCNDPVSDTPAEAIYIRDENSGDLWSATPLPIRERSSVYVVRHGFGYTRSEHTSHGISLTLTQFVPLEDPIKISRLKIRNASDEPRQLSVTHYLDWVLGNQNNRAAPFIVTSVDSASRVLLARNPWTADFKSRVAFMDMAGRQLSCTADRREFVGRHGSLAEPAALLGPQPLTGRVGGGLDPCGAMQTKISLDAGESLELTLLLGEEASADAALAAG